MATWLAVFLPLVALFFATAEDELSPLSADPVAAALSAWAVAENGSLALELEMFGGESLGDQRAVRDNAWLVPARDRTVSNRQPGVIAAGVPFYVLARPFTDGFSSVPMRMAAATYAAVAAANVALALLALGVSRRTSTGFAVAAALATPTWSVAGDALWTHGPAMAFLTAGVVLAAHRRHLWAGLAIACAVPVRTHLAVVALCVGVGAALVVQARKDRLLALAAYGVPSACAIAGVVLYTRAVFGEWSLNAGYAAFGGYPQEQLVQTDASAFIGLATNIAGFVLSPARGMLFGSPVLILLLLGLPAGWRRAPHWVRSSAVGALGYLVIQGKINGFSGGDRFWSYRLTLEVLALLAPLLWLSYAALREREALRRSVLAASGLSIGIHAVGAVFPMPWRPIDPWAHWWPLEALSIAGISDQVTAMLVASLVLGLALACRRPPRSAAVPPQRPPDVTAAAAPPASPRPAQQAQS